MWWCAWLACFDDPEGLAPTVASAPTERPELEPYRGRWQLVGHGPDGALGVRAECPGTAAAFVEVRGDTVDGWELVSGEGDDLRISSITRVEDRGDEVTFELGPDPAVRLVWQAGDPPHQLAMFPGIHSDLLFVAPAARASLPTLPPACP